MTVTLTDRYTRTHLALRTVSAETDLGMLAVRLLLALAERGGEATTADLIEDTARSRTNASGGHVRRELTRLTHRGYVSPQAARGGAPTPGTMSVWRLTGDGRRVAERVRQLATEGDTT